MRICLVISSLRSGGAERVLSRIATYWAAEHQVALITLGPPTDDFFPLHTAVRRYSLDTSPPRFGGAATVLATTWKRVRRLRRMVIELEADVVVSFGDVMNVATLLALDGTGVPAVVAERTDPRQHRIAKVWRGLRRVTYPRAAAVVVQTQRVKDWAGHFVDPERVVVIPNPVESTPEGRATPAASSEASDQWGQEIVAIGRLSREKGFDVLLHAFASCVSKGAPCHLTIVGDGPDRPALEALVRELDLSDRVSLPGRTPDPMAYLARADLFVLPSRYEGFPNALLEAMAAGLAVVATDCPSGPAEIIRDGHDGLLVPPEDVNALARAMERLMADQQLRSQLARRAREVTSRFGSHIVMKQWDDLLLRVRAAGHADGAAARTHAGPGRTIHGR